MVVFFLSSSGDFAVISPYFLCQLPLRGVVRINEMDSGLEA